MIVQSYGAVTRCQRWARDEDRLRYSLVLSGCQIARPGLVWSGLPWTTMIIISNLTQRVEHAARWQFCPSLTVVAGPRVRQKKRKRWRGQTAPHAVRAGLRSKRAPKWKLLQSDVAWLNTILCWHFLLVIFPHAVRPLYTPRGKQRGRMGDCGTRSHKMELHAFTHNRKREWSSSLLSVIMSKCSPENQSYLLKSPPPPEQSRSKVAHAKCLDPLWFERVSYMTHLLLRPKDILFHAGVDGWAA